MSSADYEERGGTAASCATSAVHSDADLSHFFPTHPASSLDDTDSSTWSSLGGALTGNTSANLSPTNFSSTATSHTNTSQSNKFNSPNLDLSSAQGLTRDESLLRDPVFPEWKTEARSPDVDNPEELQKKDPLGTQIWKLYSRTKSRLPNQERMENLTWRMMAMNLRRREQMQAAYANSIHSGSDNRQAGTDTFFSAKQAQPKTTIQKSAPSGIAQQLRKSVDKSAEQPEQSYQHEHEHTHPHDHDHAHGSDPMNLDDFIIPSSVASPSGITSPAPSEPHDQGKSAQPGGIPIATRHKPQVQIPHGLPPASMPQTSIPVNRLSEFDYVPKRVRKTSIDERRGVSLPSLHVATGVLLTFQPESKATGRVLSSSASVDRP